MNKAYTVGVKTTTTEYYRVIAENEFQAQENARSTGEFIESDPEQGEIWIEETEDLEGAANE